ncbi:hypothetical protein GCM10010309_80880 [Streptomyces violaceochromogenes]|nr:hypothetical protein GCM10010309_80880 [Streptomyces violaceochromogenes]
MPELPHGSFAVVLGGDCFVEVLGSVLGSAVDQPGAVAVRQPVRAGLPAETVSSDGTVSQAAQPAVGRERR